jgi:hypothetical protein
MVYSFFSGSWGAELALKMSFELYFCLKDQDALEEMKPSNCLQILEIMLQQAFTLVRGQCAHCPAVVYSKDRLKSLILLCPAV